MRRFSNFIEEINLNITIMLKPKVEQILNEQVGKEAYSSNLYLAMAVWSETNGLQGVAKWMYAQADEERLHMLKFIAYINERGGKAVIPAIDKPPVSFTNVLEIFEKTYEHEQYISDSINNIVGVCIDERDFSTQQWVQWFVNEQIEEESAVCSILDKLKLAGNGENLYLFDRDIFGMRTAVAVTAE